MTGNIGGLAGADALCQVFADAAELPGTYKAWLSDQALSPATRFTKDGKFVLADGPTVAESWDDLTDGELDVPIYHDALGNTVTHEELEGVWTNTSIDGTPISTEPYESCLNWTSSSSAYSARAGHFLYTDHDWTEYPVELECDYLIHLYCFQQ